ncbi:nucleotidyl transferase AbiEii/AbiGii toxin family protein [Yinghuangia sp. KLBMP8922]|uniref:Nucleotidyl transferase AbiEii/AbiGii toxin family protein n=2 Tax=Yinghuangia soli TaxID=2908204 RepID=A0AA41PYR5_9ACTN|nr:nucleotidyl transferase AbiEii/AbiGii toxin family protein [Yinghuangia soli]
MSDAPQSRPEPTTAPIPLRDPQDSRYCDLPPSTLFIPDERARQAMVFDPALKQYGDAFRAADPDMADAELGEAWRAARRRAMDAVLVAVAASPWAGSLVLRGSVLLRAWYGAAAREPGDLDFVVVPGTWAIDAPDTDRMIADLARRAAHAAGGERLAFYPELARSDEIWTYERVPGRRLVLPWAAPGVPGGVVQLDFVFGEQLHAAPETYGIPLADGGAAEVLGATPELSLAWKLVWLLSDFHPQGKDLYDAVLLAESSSRPLSHELMDRVFADHEDADHLARVNLTDLCQAARSVDWQGFDADHPGLVPDPDRLPCRLAAAVAPAFGPVRSVPQGEYLRVHVAPAGPQGWCVRPRCADDPQEGDLP